MANGDFITMQIRFTPPAGVNHAPLLFESTSDMGITLLNGVRGIDLAPVTHKTARKGKGHGSTLQATQLEEREIYIPLLIDAPTVKELDDLRDKIVETVNPLNGMGKISVTRTGDGKTRHIGAIYKEGLEGDYGSEYHGQWQTLGLLFLATEAFWEGEKVELSWPLTSTDKPFISETVNFFPVILGRTNVNGAYEIDLDGDAEVQPVWNITGPATDITITDKITGEIIYIAGEVADGETITIDTGNNKISGSARTEDELWDALSLNSILFPLRLGKNRVSVTATGLTKKSVISASYATKYLKGN